ncbi:hypothetical protein HN587_01175 [Candidatus Woesearchaeota archaeon]|jgi:phosphatidylserine/phosphatidylglycerophosphate/cardiolipin synthase-like enzyme|nr:hypothetical protein [Candidatus Woesearchaeota archaeon]
MKLKTKILILLFVIIALAYKFQPSLLDTWQSNIITGSTIIEDKVSTIITETTQNSKDPLQIYFCPRQNCADKALETLKKANSSIHCALFDLNIPEIITFLDQADQYVDVKLVVDDHNFEDVKHLSFAKKDSSSQLSHNKFCIIDQEWIFTGSFNPTMNGYLKNNNNFIVLNSKSLAKNYEAEFQELWNGQFGKGPTTINTQVKFNDILIENYFCPEDWCANQVLNQIENANQSVYFMTFSFTHDLIGDLLLTKHAEGLDIKGVFEKRQQSKYSEFEKLNSTINKGLSSDKLKIKFDKNSATMHHKVFIIDNKTVITGSFNPTQNGDTNNDENMLIIHDTEVAQMFLDEFELVFK